MNLKTWTTRLLLLGACLAACACANLRVGEPLPLEDVQELRAGYTTRDRVLTLFGQPLHKVPGEDGEIWVYRYLDGRGPGQELVISFTGNAVSTFTHR